MAGNNWVDLKELWNSREDRKWESFSWLTIRALLSSVNDIMGKGAPRIVNDLRQAWVTRQKEVAAHGRWNDARVIPAPGATSFVLLGDPGEQDFSQYAVVPVLATQDDADFMVVMSDVIYPSGDVNDYVDGFYAPYKPLSMPIYGMPGNHDWYDSLHGFMWNFCGAPGLPADAVDHSEYTLRERLALRLWTKPSKPDEARLVPHRQARADPNPWEPLQPGPYFAIETDDLLLVCVDSGITGDIDSDQAAWLVQVSESSDKRKVLLVGRPLVDKKCHKPGPFPNPVAAADGTALTTIDDIARHKPYGYVAAIGGDTHNYQRYDVTLTDPDGGTRPFHYIVSGGGGAYMSETHPIPAGAKIKEDKHHPDAVKAIRLDHFESYPTAVESLQYFAEQIVPKLFRLALRAALTAAGVLAAALAVLVFDVEGDTLETVLAATAAMFGAGLLFAFFRPGRRRRATDPPPTRSVTTFVAAFVLGVILGLAGWWLSPEHFGRHLIVFGAITAGAMVVAEWLRRSGRWREKRVAVACLLLQPVLGLAALFVVVLNDLRPVHLWLVLAAIALPVPAILLVDWLRVKSPRYYKAPLAVLVALAGVGIWLLDDSWTRAVASTAVIAIVSLVIVAIAHLHFLNATSLLLRPRVRNGALNDAEASAVIDWRAADDKTDRPDSARARLIGNMVYPGSKAPRGPVHRFISEICDRNEPPLKKNFLRVDVDDGELTITCFHATGTETGPADVTCEKPVVIPLSQAGVA